MVFNLRLNVTTSGHSGQQRFLSSVPLTRKMFKETFLASVRPHWQRTITAGYANITISICPEGEGNPLVAYKLSVLKTFGGYQSVPWKLRSE